MNIYIKNHIFKKCITEFLGTGLIILLGSGAAALDKLTAFHLNHWNISLIWGMGVTISIYLSSSISGAHLNPAITIFLWLSSQFDKKKVLPYIFSQVLGALFCTMLIYFFCYHYLIYFEYIHHIIRGTVKSLEIASIFCSYPRDNTIFVYDLFIEIISTSIFILVLMVLNNKKNYRNISLISPILIGLFVAIINMSIGSSHNITLNPARDLGPRIFLSFMGWGVLSFTGGISLPYFLIPIFGPIIGASIGGWVYILMMQKNIEK